MFFLVCGLLLLLILEMEIEAQICLDMRHRSASICCWKLGKSYFSKLGYIPLSPALSRAPMEVFLRTSYRCYSLLGLRESHCTYR